MEKKNAKKPVKKIKKTPEKSYFQEVKSELKKVKWPSREDLIKYFVTTLIFIVVFGLYFYGLDAFFAWIKGRIG